MKKIVIVVFVLTSIWSCKQDSKTSPAEDKTEEVKENINLAVNASGFPEGLQKIFDKHGGLDNWKSFNGMYFEIERPDYMEKYTVNLKERKSVIQYKDHMLGYDGENVWVKDLGTEEFKSNPRFLYNLMYYFYCMPFIIADDGIKYAEGPPLKYGDVEYPGISISYNRGVGESPDDEFILFYNPTTYQMEWLAYTVTFFSKEKTKQYSLIKYHAWTDVNGLQLPSLLQWHQFAQGVVGDQINDMYFVKCNLSEDMPDDQLFEVVEGATIAPKE